MLSVIIKMSVFLLFIVLVCFRDGYIFFRTIVFTEMYIGPRGKKCVGKVNPYLIKAMFIYCVPIFFNIVQFWHLEILVKMYNVTVMGHVQLPNFTCLEPIWLISHRKVFHLRLSHGINFWYFPFSCHSNGLS